MSRWVKAVRTPADPLTVSRAYRKALTDLVGAPSDVAVAVMHAQGALETAHFASCYNGNAGNIKRGSWARDFCTIKLNERLKRGDKLVYVWFAPEGELLSQNGPIKPGTECTVPEGHKQTQMRAYDSLADGILNKIEFLAKPPWRPALDLALAGQPEPYVYAIYDRRYFTADPVKYARSVVSLTAKFLPVARESAPPAILEPEAEEQVCLDMAECHRFELPEWLRDRVAQITALTAQQHYDEQAAERRKARDAAIRRVGDGYEDD